MTPSGIGVDPVGSGRLASRFNGDNYASPSMTAFYDNESSYKRSEVKRHTNVPDTEDSQRAAMQIFEQTFNTYGMAPMFSGGIVGHEDTTTLTSINSHLDIPAIYLDTQ